MKISIALIKAAKEQSREGQPPGGVMSDKEVLFERTGQWGLLQQEMSGDICRQGAHFQVIFEDEAYRDDEAARTEEEKVNGEKGEEDPVRHFGCSGHES